MIRRSCFALLAACSAIACSAAPDEPSDEPEWVGGSSDALQTGQIYTFRAVHSGKCLAVAGASTANLAAIEQRSCSGSASQQFRVEAMGDFVRVVNVGSGKCLDVSGA